MRTRGAQKARVQAGRVGARGPVGLFGRTSRPAEPPPITTRLWRRRPCELKAGRLVRCRPSRHLLDWLHGEDSRASVRRFAGPSS